MKTITKEENDLLEALLQAENQSLDSWGEDFNNRSPHPILARKNKKDSVQSIVFLFSFHNRKEAKE